MSLNISEMINQSKFSDQHYSVILQLHIYFNYRYLRSGNYLPCTGEPSDLTYSFLSKVVLRRPFRSCNSPHSTHHMIVHSAHHAIPQVPWKQLFPATDPGIHQTQLFGTPDGLLSQNLRCVDDGLCCLQGGLHLHIHFTTYTFHCIIPHEEF